MSELNIKETDIQMYVKNKVELNPELFGGDKGNTQLVYEYFAEVKGIVIPKYFDSISNSIVRAKNRLLEKEPRLDHRVKNKGTFTGCEIKPIEEFNKEAE